MLGKLSEHACREHVSGHGRSRPRRPAHRGCVAPESFAPHEEDEKSDGAGGHAGHGDL